MAIPILTSFDRALLLDLSSLGRPDYRKDIRAVSESTAYMVECGLLMRKVEKPRPEAAAVDGQAHAVGDNPYRQHR